MSKSNVFEQAILELIFNAVDIANIADDTVTAPATDLTVSLHTAEPGEGGDMSTSEATYTGYSRGTVARTTGGWTVTAGVASPFADIVFPVATAGSETLVAIGIGSGVGNDLMYSGSLTPSIAVNPGVTPRVTTASTITED